MILAYKDNPLGFLGDISSRAPDVNPYLHQSTLNLFGLPAPACREAQQTKAPFVVPVTDVHKRGSADGANSTLRDQHLAEYGARLRHEDS